MKKFIAPTLLLAALTLAGCSAPAPTAAVTPVASATASASPSATAAAAPSATSSPTPLSLYEKQFGATAPKMQAFITAVTAINPALIDKNVSDMTAKQCDNLANFNNHLAVVGTIQSGWRTAGVTTMDYPTATKMEAAMTAAKVCE